MDRFLHHNRFFVLLAGLIIFLLSAAIIGELNEESENPLITFF